MPTTHNADGDLLEPQRDEFVVLGPIRQVLAALALVPGAQHPERVGQTSQIVVTRAEGAQGARPGGTVVGLITVTKARLRIETNAVARANAMRAAVEQVAGDLITWRIRMSDALGPALPEAPQAPRPSSS